jgi:hypothetical protein
LSFGLSFFLCVSKNSYNRYTENKSRYTQKQENPTKR